MRKFKNTNGDVTITDANSGGIYACAIEMADDDGNTFAIDLTPDAARLMGLQLLERAGSVSWAETAHELLQGARH